MAKIPDLNLNQLKVFMAVFESRSMTAAADLLHLTQSGVSQHIKALEADLGFELFTRLGRKLIPTRPAERLYPELEAALMRISERVSELRGRPLEVSGSVRIGMPIEFGRNVIVPKLAELGQKFPRVTYEITLDHAWELNRMVLEGALDFAFIDEMPKDRRLQYVAVGGEDLLLCGSRDYIGRWPRVTYTQSYFERLDYIEYKGSEPILRRWMLHHLKRKNLRLNVRARIMDVQGLAKFISCGMGVGVLPDHVVRRLRDENIDLHVFEGKAEPLHNEIRLVRLQGHPASFAAQAIWTAWSSHG